MLHMFNGSWMPGAWGWGMMLFPGLLWLLVIGSIIWAVLLASGRERMAGRAETAMEALKRRYARGEISREERIRQDIS